MITESEVKWLRYFVMSRDKQRNLAKCKRLFVVPTLDFMVACALASDLSDFTIKNFERSAIANGVRKSKAVAMTETFKFCLRVFSIQSCEERTEFVKSCPVTTARSYRNIRRLLWESAIESGLMGTQLHWALPKDKKDKTW